VGNYFGAAGGPLNEFDNVDINRSVAFGGQIAYVWQSTNLGAEFLADFAPTFKIPSLLISDHPSLSAYMFNAIYGFRVGHLGTFRPYISGGIGAINMSADLITIDRNLIQSTISASQSRFGGKRRSRWLLDTLARLVSARTSVGSRRITTSALNATTVLDNALYWTTPTGWWSCPVSSTGDPVWAWHSAGSTFATWPRA
jgi:hypothetical protein